MSRSRMSRSYRLCSTILKRVQTTRHRSSSHGLYLRCCVKCCTFGLLHAEEHIGSNSDFIFPRQVRVYPRHFPSLPHATCTPSRCSPIFSGHGMSSHAASISLGKACTDLAAQDTTHTVPCLSCRHRRFLPTTPCLLPPVSRASHSILPFYRVHDFICAIKHTPRSALAHLTLRPHVE